MYAVDPGLRALDSSVGILNGMCGYAGVDDIDLIRETAMILLAWSPGEHIHVPAVLNILARFEHRLAHSHPRRLEQQASPALVALARLRKESLQSAAESITELLRESGNCMLVPDSTSHLPCVQNGAEATVVDRKT